MELYDIKYKLKKSNMNKWEVYYCNVVSYGIDHIIQWFNEKFGEKNYEIIDWDNKGFIHGIDPDIKDTIINNEINNVMNKLSNKTDEKIHQLQTMKKSIQDKKIEWYDIDKIINDGKEKEKEIWDKKKYMNG